MLSKKYVISPDQISSLDIVALEGLLRKEADFLYALSPDSLRSLCSASRRALDILATAISLRCHGEDEDADTLYERPGYLRPMSDQEWFGKMFAICKECFIGDAVPVDPDESGYAEYEEKQARLRIARAEKAKAKREVAEAALAKKEQHSQLDNGAVAPIDGQPLVKPKAATKLDSGADAATGDKPMPDDSGDDGSSTQPIYISTLLYRGQLNISNLLTGSRLITISANARKEWTTKNPLEVGVFSGIEAGTTLAQYTGEELHVGDIETWSTAIRCASQMPLKNRVPLIEREMLKAMRRGDAGPYYATLRAQIARLQNGKIRLITTHRPTIGAIAAAMPDDKGVMDAVESGRLELVIPMLGGSSNGSNENTAGTIYVTVPPEVRALFGKGLSSWFKEKDYYSLRNPTARRLFLLYGRHANPWPFTREELREYLGSTTKEDSDFKKILDKAFAELAAKGLIAGIPVYEAQAVRHGAKAYAVTIRPVVNDIKEPVGHPVTIS